MSISVLFSKRLFSISRFFPTRQPFQRASCFWIVSISSGKVLFTFCASDRVHLPFWYIEFDDFKMSGTKRKRTDSINIYELVQGTPFFDCFRHLNSVNGGRCCKRFFKSSSNFHKHLCSHHYDEYVVMCR